MDKLTGKGGPNRGQGRKPKPPTTKAQRRLITLPPEIDAKLKNVENASELITKLLTQYFERNP